MNAAHGRRKPARAAGHGFTLLELLVAITVLAVVSLIAWRGLDSLVTTRERLEPEADDVRAMLIAFGQMERDLAQAASPRFLGMTAPPVQVSIVDGGIQLSLARVAPPAPDRATEVQTVIYRVIDGRLVRQASPALPGFMPVAAERLETARLLDNVKLMQVRTWTPGAGWTDPNVPQDVTPGAPPRDTSIPGVEVTIERSNGALLRRVLLVGA
jgi:general secretion pathway protein J